MDLSYKERQFVAYYLGVSNGNATDAAVRAGYGSTRDSACTLGLRLLGKVGIRAAIDAKMDQVAMAQDEILARLSDIASASLGDFLEIDEDGHRVTLLKGKRRGKLHTLKKVKTKTRTYQRRDDDEPTVETETEIEVKDALPALVKLGEYRGLFKERIDVTTGDEPIQSGVIILPDNERDPIDDGRDQAAAGPPENLP